MVVSTILLLHPTLTPILSPPYYSPIQAPTSPPWCCCGATSSSWCSPRKTLQWPIWSPEAPRSSPLCWSSMTILPPIRLQPCSRHLTRSPGKARLFLRLFLEQKLVRFCSLSCRKNMIFIHLFCNNIHILLYNILILCLFVLQIGVELADNLANVYGTRCNTVHMSVARRNKYNMQEALAKDGKIRTCQQSLCRTEQEVSFVAYLCRIMVNYGVFFRILRI